MRNETINTNTLCLKTKYQPIMRTTLFFQNNADFIPSCFHGWYTVSVPIHVETRKGAYAEELERLYHNLEHTFVCKFYLATRGSAEAGLITNEGLCNCCRSFDSFSLILLAVNSECGDTRSPEMSSRLGAWMYPLVRWLVGGSTIVYLKTRSEERPL